MNACVHSLTIWQHLDINGHLVTCDEDLVRCDGTLNLAEANNRIKCPRCFRISPFAESSSTKYAGQSYLGVFHLDKLNLRSVTSVSRSWHHANVMVRPRTVRVSQAKLKSAPTHARVVTKAREGRVAFGNTKPDSFFHCSHHVVTRNLPISFMVSADRSKSLRQNPT